MSCVAIYYGELGFSHTPEYGMLRLNASTRRTTFWQKKPFPEILFLWEIGS